MKLRSAFLSAFAVAAFLASGCQQPSQPTNALNLPLTPGGASTPAHPALTYISSTTITRVTYATLGVMDSDATHQTNIYTAGTSTELVSFPCWAPGGGSICFLDGASSSALAIKAIDVSVNSNGVPVGSNLRTIYAPSASDSVLIYTPCWSQNSSTGEIAFTRYHRNYAKYHLLELCTVPVAGGSVTVVASTQCPTNSTSAMHAFRFPTWSPDDSKIAVNRIDTIISGVTVPCTLMIFNVSSGAATDSVSLAASTIEPTSLRWSHSGTNELVFAGIPNGNGTSSLSYCTPSTGASITTTAIRTNAACWSPNNSSVLYCQNPGLYKVIPGTTTSTSINTSFGSNWPVDWKH